MFDGSGEKDGVVSTEDLQAVLAGAEPSVASNLIADVMKGGVQFLDEEIRNKAHAELEQEQADKDKQLSHLNGIDELTQRSTNATPDPPPDTVNKFKERAEALMAKRRQRLCEVHEEGIADHLFVKLLIREPNVAASVRDSIRKTFHQTVGYVPSPPVARAAANPDPSTANAANLHHGHSPHIAVDVDTTANPSSDHDHDHEKRHHHGHSHSTGEDASNVTTTAKTSCCAMLWKKTKPLRSPGFVVWTLLIAAFVGRLFQWRKANGQATSDLAIAVAKGAGFAILLATCFIYMTKLPLFAWIRIFPSFWDNTSFHAHFGVGLFVFTVVHVAAHFSWQGVNAFTTKTDASTADVSSKYNLSAAWLTGTGLVMAAIIAAITISATRRRQQPESYRRFLNVHKLYYVYLPILVMHVPYRTYVLGVLLGLFALHECIKMSVTKTGNLKECSVVGSSTTRVVMENDSLGWGLLGTIPGSFYKVKVPALGTLEWHPFSLATSRSGLQPEFFVESLGAWTKQLKATVSKSTPAERKQLKMQFQGPFYAPAVNIVGQLRPVCIAAGIGITPFLVRRHHMYAHQLMCRSHSRTPPSQSMLTCAISMLSRTERRASFTIMLHGTPPRRLKVKKSKC